MELFLALEWLAQVPICLPHHLVNLLGMVFMPTLPSALQSEFQIEKLDQHPHLSSKTAVVVIALLLGELSSVA